METANTGKAAATRIGVMICSTRRPRVNPQIADFVIETIEAADKSKASDGPSLHLIDLATWNLPMYDESQMPSQIQDSSQYDHEHTRNWSREVSSYDAFIFVTPQYNWGYPASLKNAIDYLYNEWRGKPALIVSYGGHGGTKCGAQLRQVLSGVNMKLTAENVELHFGGKETTLRAARGDDLGLDGAGGSGLWSGIERTRIVQLYEELLNLV